MTSGPREVVSAMPEGLPDIRSRSGRHHVPNIIDVTNMALKTILEGRRNCHAPIFDLTYFWPNTDWKNAVR
jgi:hypothetical protein